MDPLAFNIFAYDVLRLSLSLYSETTSVNQFDINVKVLLRNLVNRLQISRNRIRCGGVMMDIEVEFENYCTVAEEYGFALSSDRKGGSKSPNKSKEFNAGWISWLGAKAQAVPEGHVVVPADILKECIEYLALASYNPNINNHDEQTILFLMEKVEVFVKKTSESETEG